MDSQIVDTSAPPRRSFLYRSAAFVVGLLAGAVPLVAGIGFFNDPLLRRRGGGAPAGQREGMVQLDIKPEAVPDDGTPVTATVFADRVDAWNYYPRQPVGSIWLRRLPDGDLVAWQSICPHLGCSVEFRAAQQHFFCPCHLSTFDLQGARQNRIPPRDMDELELAIENGAIWVKYQNFRGGIADKVAV